MLRPASPRKVTKCSEVSLFGVMRWIRHLKDGMRNLCHWDGLWFGRFCLLRMDVKGLWFKVDGLWFGRFCHLHIVVMYVNYKL